MISSLIDTVRVHAAIEHQSWIAAQSALFNAGTINPITKACAGHYRRFKVTGAFGATATVWSKKGGTELEIECSAPRFFTGQNVFGSENLREIVFKLIRTVCARLEIRPTAKEREAVSQGRVRLTRVDLTTHMKFDSDAQVEQFLKAMKLQLAFGCRYFSAYGNETLYVGQHSDMLTLKFYSKGRQIKAYPLLRDLPNRAYVEAAAEGLLRVELVLRRRYLNTRGMAEVSGWSAVQAREALLEQVCGLDLRNVRLTGYERQSALTNQANILLAAHMAGLDVETIMPSARALAAQARAIVVATGINVYVPFAAQVAGVKVDLESFAEHLKFGADPVATQLGITDGLPKLKGVKSNEAVAASRADAVLTTAAVPKRHGMRLLKTSRTAIVEPSKRGTH